MQNDPKEKIHQVLQATVREAGGDWKRPFRHEVDLLARMMEVKGQTLAHLISEAVTRAGFQTDDKTLILIKLREVMQEHNDAS